MRPITFVAVIVFTLIPAVCALSADGSLAGEYSRPEFRQFIADCPAMSPPVFEMNYLRVSSRALAGAAEWSRLASLNAFHQELTWFAVQADDEQVSLSNKYSTWLSNWYNVTQIVDLLPSDQYTLARLQCLAGREFEIAYMTAMITHFREMILSSQAVAASAPHELLRQTALQSTAIFSRESALLSQWLADWYGITG